MHSRLGVFSRIKHNNPDVIIGVLGCIATFVAHTDTPQDRKEMIKE